MEKCRLRIRIIGLSTSEMQKCNLRFWIIEFSTSEMQKCENCRDYDLVSIFVLFFLLPHWSVWGVICDTWGDVRRPNCRFHNESCLW